MKDAPPLPAFDLERFAPYRLAVAAQKTSEELARQYRTRFGITIPEWRVLVHLANVADADGAISIRDVEARVAMEKSKVSRAVTRLERAGHVAKSVNAGDRRLLSLSLTKQGRAMMHDLLPLAQAYQNEIEEKLGAALAGFEAALDALLSDAPDT